jgi:hypothetical protein
MYAITKDKKAMKRGGRTDKNMAVRKCELPNAMAGKMQGVVHVL